MPTFPAAAPCARDWNSTELMTNWQEIADHISDTLGSPFHPRTPSTIGGGCISHAVQLSDDRSSYFVKINGASLHYMFEAEATGLEELAATKTIRVPKPVCHGTTNGQSYLVLEFIQTGAPGDARSAGQQLASLHRHNGEYFGWKIDNTIGSTPQPNPPTDNWVQFWRLHRMGFQLELAAENGYQGQIQKRGELLLELFPALIDHNPQPSLLHGDLWGGNIAYDDEGHPLIFDPAVYYGDREAEIAMTELFGGFSPDFYAAYQDTWPLNPGYHDRKNLYNLYHILNHLNMFGGGYDTQALGMINRLLSELGH